MVSTVQMLASSKPHKGICLLACHCIGLLARQALTTALVSVVLARLCPNPPCNSWHEAGRL
jgi:hypothetical protein